MKWSKNELLKASGNTVAFNEQITFGKEAFDRLSHLRGLRDVTVSGSLHYNSDDDRAYADLDIEGVMIVPCSITLEDVEVPFQTTSDEVFAFVKVSEDEDVHECKGDVVELLPVIFQLILMEVPLKTVKPGIQAYPKGKGWEVVKEEDYVRECADEIDPRLAKLRDFKIEE